MASPRLTLPIWSAGWSRLSNVDTQTILGNIPVTLTPDEQTGFDIFHTLQGPIQTPVSPDEKWAATAVFSLTNVSWPPTDSADHVAIIDTTTDQVVAFVPTPAGTHGVNWGAKLGGGYYAYVTNQHANVLRVIDPDPNGDGNGADAATVGSILLTNRSKGAGETDGTRGARRKTSSDDSRRLDSAHGRAFWNGTALVGS